MGLNQGKNIWAFEAPPKKRTGEVSAHCAKSAPGLRKQGRNIRREELDFHPRPQKPQDREKSSAAMEGGGMVKHKKTFCVFTSFDRLSGIRPPSGD